MMVESYSTATRTAMTMTGQMPSRNALWQWPATKNILFPQITQPVTVEPRLSLLHRQASTDRLTILPFNNNDVFRLKLLTSVTD